MVTKNPFSDIYLCRQALASVRFIIHSDHFVSDFEIFPPAVCSPPTSLGRPSRAELSFSFILRHFLYAAGIIYTASVSDSVEHLSLRNRFR